MKIKRFVAADMRQAMRDVRQDQGAEAVILSTRRLAEGIEIIAAVDYDESLVREAARHGSPLLDDVATAAEVKTPPPAVETPAPSRLWRRSAAAPGPLEGPKKKAAALARKTAEPIDEVRISATAMAASRAKVPAVAAPPAALPADAAQPVVAQLSSPPPAMDQPAPGTPFEPPPHPMIERAAQETARMRAELGSMREMLELQLSSLAWNDMERRQPLRARVLREMTRLGIDADVARQLADDLPQQISPEQARYLPLGMISRRLRVTGREQLESAGVTALVGPTGVGKTTTIAKLAARAVVRHGVGQVALVSTDHYRIGAAAQLEHYGRLLGVRVYPADDAQSLRQVLQMLHGKHSVLVDTAGVSGTDPRLEQQMDILNEVAHGGGVELRSCIVLAANAQSQALEESMRAYLSLDPGGCILTKLDEAPSLGGALSVLMRHRLSLDYTTDGQRVPEDIAAADARVLVLRAAHGLKNAGSVVDDGIMADRFGLAAATA